MKWKHIDSPVKKKFQVQQSVKKVMLPYFSNMKRPIPIDFLEKGSTVNSASYLLYHWFNKGIPQVQAEELASLSESD